MRQFLDLPLHYGQAPAWLFERMQNLGYLISGYIIREHGTKGFLERLGHPLWFQGLGTILGFDWHSSGLTTTLTAALKQGFLKDKSLGIKIAGGKGKTSLETPNQILELGGNNKLVKISKLVAKVDNTLVQDGFNLYHHCLFFDTKNNWAVVQQGLKQNGWARRYHWVSFGLNNFTLEPHSGVVSSIRRPKVLNLVHKKSLLTQKGILYLACKPQIVLKLKQRIPLSLPKEHSLMLSHLSQPFVKKVFLTAYEKRPKRFSDLVLIKGLGPKTMRALALISDLIFNTHPCFEDVKTYSFALGGKDGYPYPVDREVYDKVIKVLSQDIQRVKIKSKDKDFLLKRIEQFYG